MCAAPYPRHPCCPYPVRMDENPWRAPRLSTDAMLLMALLLRHGGGMRIGPLLRISRLTADQLAAAVNELIERLWIEAVWLSDHARRSDVLPERLRDVRRIVTNSNGRHCYRYTPKF